MQLKSRSSLLAIAFALILGVIIGGTAVAATQVHMRNALSDLESASTQLQSATADKAGHRQQAISLVSQAIHQVNMGIAAGSY
ncbi:MAG TPA: hypothetical protein VGK84_04975 [Candidatus Tumulicola sp.]